MIRKIQQIKSHHRELGEKMMEAASDPKTYSKLAKEYSRLERIIQASEKLRALEDEIQGDREIIESSEDEELMELAKEELPELETKRDEYENAIRLMLLPPDPRDNRNIIVEIRAGTGGQEASLFAGDLYRMYRSFAERNNWKMDTLSSNPSDLGGFKEVIFSIAGEGVYSRMKFESGVHRVQRVPVTEASGRIHTSAATVAVLPEAEEVEVEINPDDLKIDVFRSSGPGGQSVNTTDSAVRITHIPTGLVVTCQDEKSQLKNKVQALKVLRARLYNIVLMEQEAKEAQMRRQMVSTGDRSAKIRTYNFPQGRVTDHRIKLTLYRLEEIMDGDIGELVERLRTADSEEQLASLELER
ncbi:MAG: peptide chain release factor 1 [candidate division Zixibacteria bacterium]|nr:peptide chain release factor 1 [Candidatus Tariuqbacter arcticus]